MRVPLELRRGGRRADTGSGGQDRVQRGIEDAQPVVGRTGQHALQRRPVVDLHLQQRTARLEGLQAQLGAVISNTEWNGSKVLSGEVGSSGSVEFHVGASSADHFTVDMSSLDTGSLHDVMQSSVLISSRSDATSALTSIDDALTQLADSRSTWGAASNRLVHAADNAMNVSMNSSASRSRIMDTDYAQTTADMARAMILNQAGSAMLSQANHQPMLVLALLR